MPIKLKEKFLPHFLGDTKEAAEELYSTFQKDLNMLSTQASRLSRLDKEDLFQEAVIGLARAARDFERARSDNFRIFAIYKIKDALRDYIAGQKKNIRVPQYINDARKLIRQLAETLRKGTNLPQHHSLSDIWELSLIFEGESSIKKDVEGVQNSLKNLAIRTHTTTSELISRVELMPHISESIDGNTDVDMITDPETAMIDAITNKDAIGRIKKHLSKDEFNLLYLRFVEGYTFKDLEEKFNITEESLNVKLKKILAELTRKKGVILSEDTETHNPFATEVSACANGG